MSKTNASLGKIRPEIRVHIKNNVLPEYHKLKGHTDQHIRDVIRHSLEIADTLDDINYDMVYVIASYHDLGRLVDNETHHLESAKMLRADPVLKKYFTESEIETMAEAVEDHRASLKGDPRSIYGKIVSSADRSRDIDEVLARAYDYNRILHPTYTDEQTIEAVRLVLRGKYTPDGYGAKKMYFKDPSYDDFLKKIDELTKTKEGFYKIQSEFNRKRFSQNINSWHSFRLRL